MAEEIKISIRPMTQDERNYGYTLQEHIEASGCIGHLRADMGSNGRGFYSTWDDYQPDRNTPEFKAEFDNFINALRDDPQYDDVLKSRFSLAAYCFAHPEAKYEGSVEYGFRADTEKYSYMLRLNPGRDAYNIYCYAYIKEQLDQHLDEQERTETKSNKSRLKEITESIEGGIRDVFASDRYAEYLQTMSRFHRYSFNNTMLIHMQRPDATRVAGFNKWRDDFKRNVKKGEKGIKIIAPTPYKKMVERAKLDPDTKAPMLDENGKAIMEEKEISIPYFRVVTVFDVSQTEGEPLPVLAAEIKGAVKHYDAFMEALKRSSPVPVAFEKLPPNMDGVFREKQQNIGIREGMSEAQTVAATVHEITHAKLHNAVFPAEDDPTEYQKATICGQPALYSKEKVNKDTLPGGLFVYELRGGKDKSEGPVSIENKVVANFAGTVITAKPVELSKTGYKELSGADKLVLTIKTDTVLDFYHEHKKNQRTQEVEAESVAYAVCQYYGIETAENSFGYIAGWSKGKELDELRDSLTTINATASSLISNVDKHFREVCKEWGIDPKATDIPEKNGPDQVLFLLDGSQYLHIQSSDSGYDYTLYDASTMRNQDGGQLDVQDISIYEACTEICQMHDLKQETVKACSLATLDELHAANELPPPVALDSYPMPDPALTAEALAPFGADAEGLLPLSQAAALEQLGENLEVYYMDNGEIVMAITEAEITALPDGTVFGIPAEAWEQSPKFLEQLEQRKEQQEQREAAFDAYPGDCYAIYQVKKDPENYTPRAFMSYAYMTEKGLDIKRENYNLIYTSPATEPVKLEDLFYKFNNEWPKDFGGHSLSVSDIVAIKQDGHVSYHYCDSVGFQELPDFRQPDNYLKNAEVSVEDDYGMIDGIINNGPKQPTVAELEEQVKSGQSISVLDLARAVHAEKQHKKPSVLEQLKNQPKQSKISDAPKKSAEREI